jgi:methylmalonate-semialdehyde dehydrogenase [acylating] (EC 1.2.1.27)
MTRSVRHFIAGKAVEGRSGRFGDVFNPNTGEVQARVDLASAAEVDAAVRIAVQAQAKWAQVNPQRRARVMFAFKGLLEKHMDELAHLLSSEHGKVLADSRGDIQRGLEVIEFACGIPHLLKGDYTEGAGPGIDVYSMRQPLGVVAGITPFNFPAMIPMWMFGVAIACGNAFILKPSEKDPSVPVRLAELMMEAGLPDGVLNVVHGDKEAVDAILTHPDIKAVSFCRLLRHRPLCLHDGRCAWKTHPSHGRRQEPWGGAARRRYGSGRQGFGRLGLWLGRRTLHGPAGRGRGWQKHGRRADRAALAGNPHAESWGFTDPDAHYGPVVTAQHRDKIKSYIRLGEEEGADLVVDGRDFALQGFENGFFIGPSLFDKVTPQMRSYQEEIFGPVLQIMRAETLDEAAALPSNHQYGNGVAIFTRNGRAAREFASKVNVGMVGVNVPIPVPVAYHSFGGWKRSAFGDTNQHGVEGVKFFTKIKTVTARWPDGDVGDQSFIIPTMR